MHLKNLFAGFAALALLSSTALAGPIAYSTVNIAADTPQAPAIALVTAINTQLAPTGTGNVSSAIDIPTVASAVNQFKLTPGATTVVPILQAGGPSADTNIGLALNGNGTGGVYLGGSTAANSAVGVLKGTTNVNQLVLTGTNTGSAPSIVTGGSGVDTNVGMFIAGNGTGVVGIGGTTTTLAGLQVAQTASRVNSVVITPSATTVVPSITLGGAGADANRNLSVAGSGTGLVILGQTICTVTGASPQTCNGQRGIVTSGTLTTAAATNAAYTINNSSVTASSLVQCTVQGYSGTLVTNGYPTIMSCVPGSGAITVNITNTHAANALSGTVAIGFAVLN